ncbi:MAG: LysR substrate-binding domain-containing protein [Cardiobacteriaceae bacterium]|nr:LysR substrate-binding domain-containing protein [Cardiobacteriaceae bacterium]
MNLKQLQCIDVVVKSNFNVTAAAERLHLSQPGVSKHIKLLEEAMGAPIFRRHNRNFEGLTELGEAVHLEIQHILAAVDNIRALAQRDFSDTLQLTIATTATLARYRLVQIMPGMQSLYPQLPLHIQEGTNAQILQMVQEHEADFGWFSASDLTPYHHLLRRLVMLPAEDWHAVVIVPKNHSLAKRGKITPEDLAGQPLITYVTSHKGPSALSKAFANRGLAARIVMTARDADMIKNYVRHGMGIGIIADMAHDDTHDKDLVKYTLDGFLPVFTTYLVWVADKRLRNFHYSLIENIIPGANQQAVADYVRRMHQSEEPGWVI